MIKDKLLKARVGDLVCLNDKISLQEYSESVQVSNSITRIFSFRTSKGGAVYHFFEIKNQKHPDVSFIVLTIVDNLYKVGLYFEVNEFSEGFNRQDCIEHNLKWLFQTPADENNFEPSDLKFTEVIEMGDVKYEQKFSTLYGELRGNGVEFCSLTEYHSPNDIENKEVIILEIGGLDENKNQLPEGGSINIKHGRIIQEHEIDVFSDK